MRMKGNYIITTDGFFFGKDGKQYRAVWGNVEIVEDSILGIKTNRNSSNWFAKVGSEDNHVLVAGCQIHYANRCEVKPELNLVPDFSTASGELKEFEAPSQIYIAE